MIAQPKHRAFIVVVDPEPNDYLSLSHTKELGDADFEFLKSARDALRFESERTPELWIINMNLPDMSGLDVYTMLVSRWPGVPVYLVGDDYRPEDEVSARSSGATFYFCKPLDGRWLAGATADLCDATYASR